MPTVAILNTQTPGNFSFDSAERVARRFLDAWQQQDYATMHSLITFSGQEATSLDDFTALYQDSRTTMSLQSLDYEITSQYLNDNSVMLFNYDVTFHTALVGTFSDPSRSLRLVYDSSADDWRVAWSPADIFALMGSGGQLRFEPRIPSRANIYDINGKVLADQNGRVIAVSVIKKDIPAYETCLARLAVALNKSGDDLKAFLDARPEDWLVELGTIEPVVYVQAHQELESDCKAQFQDRPARRYADGSMSANLIGYVGYPSEAQLADLAQAGFPQDSIVGQSGIEASWDETLRGKPGGRLTIVLPDGSQVLVAEGASQPSESLWLTIDQTLQDFVERTLTRAFAHSAWAATSHGASAIIMDIHTGAILAMASYPSFDNNAFTPFPSIGQTSAQQIIRAVQNDDRRPQLNRPTLGIYPAGSTFKVIPAIAAADSGVYALDQRYNSTGTWNRDITRYDWLPGGHGLLTLPNFITQSCNSCFYETGYQLNQADPFLLPDYARRMGLGAVTGLKDLPEAAGNIIDPDTVAAAGGIWTFSDAVNMAIGQGAVQVTPLQMVRLFATIANGGTLYRPQLVQKVGILGENPSFELQPDKVRDTAIKPEVLQMVQGALCAVTTQRAGTAEFVFRGSPLQDNIGVCGKTGTAQATGDVPPHAWFAAYAPRENPEISIVVMIENAGEGSEVAAPLVRQILEYYFLGIDNSTAP